MGVVSVNSAPHGSAPTAGTAFTRSPAANAELALLLEVAGTPKPGNVDRARDHPDLHFEHFLAGAVGARPGLEMAAEGSSLGRAFERAVAGMSAQSGGNTQFGSLLLLTPLVRPASTATLTPETVTRVVEETTVDDAVGFYRAFEHVDVAVGDPPDGMEPLDVRRGTAAVPAVKEREVTLYDIMARSADHDGIAAEWTGGFERTFATADRITDDDGPLTDRAARAFLWLLADEPDTLLATTQGEEIARSVTERAREARERGPNAVETLADELVAEGLNPGTTADLVAGGLFVALESGEVSV